MAKASVHFKPATDSNRYHITAPKRYDPLKDEGRFMNHKMLAHFWQKLCHKQTELTADIDAIRGHAVGQDKAIETGDIAQRHQASNLDAGRLEKLGKFRAIVGRMINEIETKGPECDYGYCVDTGEQIEVARLVTTPWATRTVEAQQGLERHKNQHARTGGAIGLTKAL